MASQWFYRIGAREFGPITPSDIRSLVSDGTVVPETLLRRDGTTAWTKASRIKGLFPEAPEVEQPDPLIAMGSQAASSVASAAGAAVSAVSGWLSRPKQVDDTPNPGAQELDAGWISLFTRDNQPADVVTRVREKLSGILMAGEELSYIAVQNKPIANWFPDCIALTNRRFILYRPKLLGRVDFEDFVWRELRDARLSENIIGSTVTIKTAANKLLSLDYLPKAQARAIYRIAQEMEEASLQERRLRQMEEARASAGGVVVQANLAAPPPQDSGKVIVQDDPVSKLQKLKAMLDMQLISAEEYENKKSEILSRM